MAPSLRAALPPKHLSEQHPGLHLMVYEKNLHVISLNDLYYRNDEELCLRHLPRLVKSCMKCLLRADSAKCAAATLNVSRQENAMSYTWKYQIGTSIHN